MNGKRRETHCHRPALDGLAASRRSGRMPGPVKGPIAAFADVEAAPATRSRIGRLAPCLAFLLAGTVPVTSAGTLTLVHGGKSSFQIVCSLDEPESTRFAATELQYFLERSTGAKLPIVTPEKKGPNAIVLKTDPSLPIEGFRIAVEEGDVVIRGHDTPGDPKKIDFTDPVLCGTMSGVYEFLERFVGVRFYWPEELGTIVPKRDDLVVPDDFRLAESPYFSLRQLQYGPQWVSNTEEAASQVWGRRLRLGASRGYHFNHNWWRILNVEDWASRGHEEYAALVNGIRRTRYEMNPTRRNGQVCTANPEVQAIFVEAAKKSPASMFSVSPNDGHSGFCQCELCRAQDGEQLIPDGKFDGYRDLSDRLVGFYSTIAERADRDVGGYAYNEYLESPTNAVLHPRVYISVAINNAFLSGNPTEKMRAERILPAWGALAPRTTLYDILYHKLAMENMIAPLDAYVDERLALLKSSGLSGALFYIAPEMEQGGADAYVAARLLWDPHLDPIEIRKAYYHDLYANASDTIAAFYRTAAEAYARAAVMSRSSNKHRAAMREMVPKLKEMVAQAAKEAGEDRDVQARLTRLRKAMERMQKAR